MKISLRNKLDIKNWLVDKAIKASVEKIKKAASTKFHNIDDTDKVFFIKKEDLNEVREIEITPSFGVCVKSIVIQYDLTHDLIILSDNLSKIVLKHLNWIKYELKSMIQKRDIIRSLDQSLINVNLIYTFLKTKDMDSNLTKEDMQVINAINDLVLIDGRDNISLLTDTINIVDQIVNRFNNNIKDCETFLNIKYTDHNFKPILIRGKNYDNEKC